jgi:adenylosuccinate synthase
MQNIIAISGPIAVGKSAFIEAVLLRLKGVRISTRQLILDLRTVRSERGALQEAGDALDLETDGKWVADALSARIKGKEQGSVVVVDSVRIGRQVHHLRERYADSCKHIHLTASYETLAKRFMHRIQSGGAAVTEFATYDEVRSNGTEAGIEQLAAIADLVLNIDDRSPENAADEAICGLKLASNT